MIYKSSLSKVTRKRSTADERSVSVFLTDSGEALKEKAVEVPARIAGCVGLEPNEAVQLYGLLYKVLNTENNIKGLRKVIVSPRKLRLRKHRKAKSVEKFTKIWYNSKKHERTEILCLYTHSTNNTFRSGKH